MERTPSPDTPTIANYVGVRRLIRTGDLALYRPTRWSESLQRRIAYRSRLPETLKPWEQYAHVGVCIWWHDVLMFVDIVTSGGRAIRLSRELARYPKQYDIRRIDGLKNVNTFCRKMIEMEGTPYGWGSLFYAALSIYGVLPATADADVSMSTKAHCAQAVSLSLVEAEEDPFADIADMYTTPNMLASVTSYMFTPVVSGETT